MITISVISKHADDRAAISALLTEQADFRVVSVGADGYDALKAATDRRPDIIIMDFRMEDIASLELAPIIRRKSPSTALIALSSPDDQDAAAQALKAGITGCLFKQDGFCHLVPAIRSVLHGGWYVSKSVKDLVLNTLSSPLEAFPADMGVSPLHFTPTETGIFYGIIHGHTDREIARNLNIEIGSLRNCINRVKKRTGLQNRVQITIHALLAGIIRLEKNGYRHTGI